MSAFANAWSISRDLATCTEYVQHILDFLEAYFVDTLLLTCKIQCTLSCTRGGNQIQTFWINPRFEAASTCNSEHWNVLLRQIKDRIGKALTGRINCSIRLPGPILICQRALETLPISRSIALDRSRASDAVHH